MQRFIYQGEYSRGIQTLMSAGLAEHKENCYINEEKHPIAEYSFFKAMQSKSHVSQRGVCNGLGAEHLNAAQPLKGLSHEDLS